MIQTVLALWPIVQKLMGMVGIDREKQDEMKLRLLDREVQRDIAQSEEFAAFIQATSPDPQYVPRWINGLQAATRPLITWIAMGTIVASIWIPGLAARAAATLEAFSNAGTFGLLFILPVLWWFMGRSAEKLLPGLLALRGVTGDNGGTSGHDVTDTPRGGGGRAAEASAGRPTNSEPALTPPPRPARRADAVPEATTGRSPVPPFRMRQPAPPVEPGRHMRDDDERPEVL